MWTEVRMSQTFAGSSTGCEAAIVVSQNPEWITNRPANKYSPVIVASNQTVAAITSMQELLRQRIAICQHLAIPAKSGLGSGFAFIRHSFGTERLHSGTVPVIVISGGSAGRLAALLQKNYSLAWHPVNLRGAPLYLMVHRHEFNTYAAQLQGLMLAYHTFHLIGWSGGKMSGFGTSRAAVMAFADTLPYRPQRILLLDQDVAQMEATRPTRPKVNKEILALHRTKKIVGIGVGYPTRGKIPQRQEMFNPDPAEPAPEHYESPTQQFVSIQAPFRSRKNDGIYPAYMVAGGEDMLMSLQVDPFAPNLLLPNLKKNTSLRSAKILKIELNGQGDSPNPYWNRDRLITLDALYAVEKDIFVEYHEKAVAVTVTIRQLLYYFLSNGWINDTDEFSNVSACIVERMILRLYKLGKFPSGLDTTVFQWWLPKIEHPTAK